jgi:fructose-bisphosphate aldolase class II
MYDASALDDAANVAATAEVTRSGHAQGAWVEAELGAVGGKDGIHSATARTDPDDAVRYVRATGVDALAVAVGSSHARPTRDAALDLELAGRLRAVVPVPLVLHGSSGVPDEGLAAAVHAGFTKINIATQLNRVFTAAVRQRLAEDAQVVDPRRYLDAGRDAIADEVARLVEVLGARTSPGPLAAGAHEDPPRT